MLRNLSRTTAVAVVGGVVLALVGLTGCGGSSHKKASPDPHVALAKAKTLFDQSPSVHLALETSARPRSGNAVLSADGIGTHQPAFKGEVRVVISGLTANVPVVSVGGKVHAKLPLTLGYNVIDPAEYDAPDPADFMSPTRGISSLLTQLDKPRRTGQARAGSKIVTTYAGTLAGTRVKTIIPSATASATYRTTVNLDSAGRVSSVRITGPFFSGAGDVTYDLALDRYGQKATITAP